MVRPQWLARAEREAARDLVGKRWVHGLPDHEQLSQHRMDCDLSGLESGQQADRVGERLPVAEQRDMHDAA